MRNVVKKMHGLSVFQNSAYGAPLIQDSTSGTSTNCIVQFESDLSPVFYNTYTLAIVNTDQEVYMKRMRRTVYYTNVDNMPCYMEVSRFVARSNIGNATTITNIMQQDAPAINLPYISPLSSNAFQKQFKIISSKRVLFMPGTLRKVSFSRQFKNSKPATGRLEGNTGQYQYTKGNVITLTRFWGMPVSTTSGGTPQFQTTLGSINIRTCVVTYSSFYTMDDITPNSVTLLTIPNVQPSVGAQYYPTRTMLTPVDIATQQTASIGATPQRVIC